MDIKNGTVYIEENNDYNDNDQYYLAIEETYNDQFECFDKIYDYIYLGYNFIKDEKYLIGYQILKAIAKIKLLWIIPGCDVKEWFSFNRLWSDGYLDVDSHYFYHYLIYGAIQSQRGYREIYQAFELADLYFYEFSEIITIHVNEITNKDSLIHNWINYLKDIKTDMATTLLEDACTCIDNDELLKFARKACQKHPILYQIYMQRMFKLKDIQQGLKIGYEALEAINDNLAIKAKIADLMLKYDNSSYLREIAFLAEPSVYHCLRLTDNLDKVKNTFDNNNYNQQNNCIDELKISKLTIDERYLYLFILGDHENIINQCLNNQMEDENLKKIIQKALLLLLKPGILVHQGDDYLMTALKKEMNFDKDYGSFIKYFKLFKKRFHLTYEFKADCIFYLEQEIAFEAKDKMGNNRRKDYVDIASKIVVLAQILVHENRIENMNVYLDAYKKMYNQKKKFKEKIDESSRLK